MMILASLCLPFSPIEVAVKSNVVFLGTRNPGLTVLAVAMETPCTPVFKFKLDGAEAGETDPLEGRELP